MPSGAASRTVAELADSGAATSQAAEATAHDRRLRSPAFKRAFLVSFADRVAERLHEARRATTTEATRTYGDDLLPVLAEREAAVEQVYRDTFPNVRVGKARSYDARGWYAGREAAERADIGAGAAITRGR